MAGRLRGFLLEDPIGNLLRNRFLIDREKLEHLTEELFPRSKVRKIEGEELPGEAQMPYLVYWSADWCVWCPVFTPTFFGLAPFFKKAPLYFCEKESLRRLTIIEFVPQITAHFPGGVLVRSTCGNTTGEFWERLNLLLSLGVHQRSGDFTLYSSTDENQLIPTR